MLVKIEQMVMGLLPISSDGVPDVEGTGSPDIAQLVLQTQNSGDKAIFPSLFARRSDTEVWYQIARDLAKALILIDSEHRKIIKEIQNMRSAT